MQTITFDCSTISPMFLSGADGDTPELRPPSIKGAMRFWWRALNGHLSLQDLREREIIIFGDTLHRSSFSIHVEVSAEIMVNQKPPVPHKNYTKPAIVNNTAYKVIFRFRPISMKGFTFTMEHLKSLFEITITLGGFGKRVRRGMGSCKILSIDSNPVESITNLQTLINRLHVHSPHYKISNNSIIATYTGAMLQFGWIQRIEIGHQINNLLRVISDATHDLKGKYGNKYEPNMGHASNGRFSSPVFVSIIENGIVPVYIFLNPVPDRGKQLLDTGIRNEFRDLIQKKQ